MSRHEDLARLKRLRQMELEALIPWIPPHAKILELGGSMGWQACLLSQIGCSVDSFDIKEAEEQQRYYPVRIFDGSRFPVGDVAYDLVFTSHMLLYVLENSLFFDEMRRVLKPGGQAIHVMPTPAWRWWACVWHYPAIMGRVLARMRGRIGRVLPDQTAKSSRAEKPRTPNALAKCLLPGPLGPGPSVWSEWRRWQPAAMRALFARHSFRVSQIVWIPLFYVPGFKPAGHWSARTHHSWASLLGSCSVAYVTTPQE